MFGNEKVIAEAESRPKVSIGAIVCWVIAALIMSLIFLGIGDPDFIYLVIGAGMFAFFPALCGLILQLAMLSGAKGNVIIATERCIYCKNKSARRYAYGSGLMELPYEAIMNIRVAPEGLSRINGDMLSLYLPGNMLSFRYITNAPQIVMAIKGMVEERKGPMPPMGYGAMMPMMGYAPPYGQPMYGQPPMQQGYGQSYGQNGYQAVQPNYAAPPQYSYQPVPPEYQQPMQNVYADKPPAAPARAETFGAAKPAESFDIPNDGDQPQ